MGRDTGRARGGIAGAQDAAENVWDVCSDVRDTELALESLLEVEERGGAFPTYPHCPNGVVSRWRE